MSIDLDVLERDLETVREMVGHYAGNSQFDAWQRVEAIARSGGQMLDLANQALQAGEKV